MNYDTNATLNPDAIIGNCRFRLIKGAGVIPSSLEVTVDLLANSLPLGQVIFPGNCLAYLYITFENGSQIISGFLEGGSIIDSGTYIRNYLISEEGIDIFTDKGIITKVELSIKLRLSGPVNSNTYFNINKFELINNTYVFKPYYFNY